MTSTLSPTNQKIVTMDEGQLKKINDKLSQLCSELDIDEQDIQIDYGITSDKAIQDSATNYSHIPIVIQAGPSPYNDDQSRISPVSFLGKSSLSINSRRVFENQNRPRQITFG